MKKKNTSNLLLVIFVFTLLFSCKKTNDAPAKNELAGNSNIPVAVEQQINGAKQNLASLGITASIISFKTESEIKDESQLEFLKKSMIAGENIVPAFDGKNASSFSVSSINERMSASKSAPGDQQDVVQNIRNMVYPELKTGQKVMDILWEANGKQFHTKCVYDDNGVVYDNMLSNITLTEMVETPANELKLSPEAESNPNAKTSKQYSFTSTVVNYTIKWLWGSTRGRIIIKHYIIWNGYNYIYDHGGTSDAWMSVGSASGRWANNYLNRRSRSKMAWGYGWATPSASFSIKFSKSSLSFSTSVSGVGSKGSGSGIHTIYL